ncbi:MAG TPA: hypothetical protein VGM76_14940 [Lacipirellulaceae bacterium]|jgi:hypothetical protein
MANDHADFVSEEWPTLLSIDDDPQISETIVARLGKSDSPSYGVSRQQALDLGGQTSCRTI